MFILFKWQMVLALVNDNNPDQGEARPHLSPESYKKYMWNIPLDNFLLKESI